MPSSEITKTRTIITTKSNELIAKLHDRCRVILGDLPA